MKLNNQNQHRIPQVYLRLWSFKDKGNADTICVLKKGDPVAHPRRIKTFTAEQNLFDTTIHDEGFERFFDEKCKYVENNYPKVISGLIANNYDGQTRIYLAEFISNIFVRQRKTFEFITSIVGKEHLRTKLLNEIALFEKEDVAPLIKEVYEMIAIDKDHSIDSKVSAVILQAWKHFNKLLQQFDHIILKAPSNRNWFTSDNPIITTNPGKDGWLLGLDAEVYFPISKEYLVYMFLRGKGTNEKFRELLPDTPVEISLDEFDLVMNNIIRKSDPDYFILGEDLCFYNAETDKFQSSYKPVDEFDPHEYRETISLVGTPTPPSLEDSNLEKLLKKIDAEFEPIILKVETHPDALENECIAIVDRMVAEKGGRRILGWQIWEGPYIMEAEFHAVWETSNGILKDISLKKNKAPYIVFVEDERINYTGKQINNIRINLSKSRLVDDFIEVCNQQFRLLNKADRAFLYGRSLADNLTTTQLENINKVANIRALIWNLLDSGGDEHYPCPCNSNRKYKNCHHKIVRELRRLG